jgi:hypothetical protein
MRKRILALRRELHASSSSAEPRLPPSPKSRATLGFFLSALALCAGACLWQNDIPALNQHGLRISLGIATGMLFLAGARMFLAPFFRWLGDLDVVPFGIFLFFLGCGIWAWLYYDETLSKALHHLLGWTNAALVFVGLVAAIAGSGRDLAVRTLFTGHK